MNGSTNYLPRLPKARQHADKVRVLSSQAFTKACEGAVLHKDRFCFLAVPKDSEVGFWLGGRLASQFEACFE